MLISGTAAVTLLPKMTEQGDPRGVTWTTLKPSAPETSASSLHPRPVRRTFARSTSETGMHDYLELHVNVVARR